MSPLASPSRFPSGLRRALLSVVMLSAGAASASPEYPSIVRSELGMDCTPDCSICHTVSPGLQGTAQKPFVGSLQPLFAQSPDMLRTSLQRINMAPFSDADMDTFTDVDELRGVHAPTEQLTTDPNTADTATMPSPNVCPPEPVYGCGAAHVTRRPHAHAEYGIVGALGALALAGAWRRLRQRRAS